MAKGLLELTGTIDLAQFWPDGESDADTAKVTLSGNSAFRFRAHPGAPFKITTAFEGATVHGKVSKAAIDTHSRVTIRLQGIDAPELHYRPTAPTLKGKKPTPAQRTAFNAANGNFRQNFGETATVALLKFLTQAGNSPIKCVVRTAVDEPGEVFDTFGRMVGDIFVTINGVEQNANHWLCSKGWAFPTFYTSMTNQEITDLTTISEKARGAKAGIWDQASSNLNPFDPKLMFRNHGKPNPSSDVGPVILPKLFRRRSTFGVAPHGNLWPAGKERGRTVDGRHSNSRLDQLQPERGTQTGRGGRDRAQADQCQFNDAPVMAFSNTKEQVRAEFC